MALPVYANDMTTIAYGDIDYDVAQGGVWDESTDGGWDTGGAMVDDLNLYYTNNIVNTGEADNSCTSAQYTKDGTGSGTTGPGTIIYVHPTSFTVPTDGIVSIDSMWAAPPALNPYAGTFGTAEAGVSVLIGTTLGDFDVHYVAGDDLFPATDGVYTTYFVDPTITPAGTVGAVTTLNSIGIAIAAVAQARGNPNACQTIRYGRAEVSYTLGEVANPATFEGYALVDNVLADKFNLLQEIEGGYKARGLMTFGTATDAVYFRDSDKSIVIADDLKVGPNFNKGIVNNASSELYWSNISITNLGSVAKYTFSNPDNAITEHIGGTFLNTGAFSYGSNSTNIGAIYRGQELVSQLGATFTSCSFDKSVATSALLADDLDIVSKCTFNSLGTGYGADLGTITTNTDLIWDNFESDYVTGAAGNDVGLTPTGNETLLANVSAGIILNISIASGASTPSVADAGPGTGIINVIAGQNSLTLTGLSDGIEVRIRQGSHTLQHTQDVSGGQVVYTYTYTGDEYVTVSFSGAGIIQSKTLKLVLSNVDQTSLVTFVNDPSYT